MSALDNDSFPQKNVPCDCDSCTQNQVQDFMKYHWPVFIEVFFKIRKMVPYLQSQIRYLDDQFNHLLELVDKQEKKERKSINTSHERHK